MWWGLSISLTKEGEEHVTDILQVVYQYLQVRQEGDRNTGMDQMVVSSVLGEAWFVCCLALGAARW